MDAANNAANMGLRFKEPPALPAEVEAVIAKLLREADACSAGTLEDDADLAREAATLLRRYAQAVAEIKALCEPERRTGACPPTCQLPGPGEDPDTAAPQLTP